MEQTTLVSQTINFDSMVERWEGMDTAWKNVIFPARKSDFPLFLMYFFISKVKISLQMDKFPGNDLAKMPIFFPSWVWTTANPGCKPCRKAVCKCDHKTVGKWQFWLYAFHATSSEPSMLCAASSAVLSRLYTNIWFFIFSVISFVDCFQNFALQAGVYISNFYSPDDKFTRHWRAGVCKFQTLLIFAETGVSPLFLQKQCSWLCVSAQTPQLSSQKSVCAPLPPLKIPGSAPVTFVSNLNCWNRNMQFTVPGLRSHVTKPCFLF